MRPTQEEMHEAMAEWAPIDVRKPCFGLSRDKSVVSFYDKPLTRWTRARWWLARKIEWLACLVGGGRWCP